VTLNKHNNMSWHAIYKYLCYKTIIHSIKIMASFHLEPSQPPTESSVCTLINFSFISTTTLIFITLSACLDFHFAFVY